MVSEDIFRDLLSYNLPLVFIGDHAQLEPIGNGFNIMQKPDYVLETIHRNASTIAKFANHLRQGNSPESFTEFDDMVQIKKRSELKKHKSKPKGIFHGSIIWATMIQGNKTFSSLNQRKWIL